MEACLCGEMSASLSAKIVPISAQANYKATISAPSHLPVRTALISKQSAAFSFTEKSTPFMHRLLHKSTGLMPLGVSSALEAEETEPSPSSINEFVELAHQLADAAGDILLQYFRKRIEITDKEDMSPVTIADQAAEQAMRSLISKQFPSHAIFGEEWGLDAPEGDFDFVWVLDPIDGTKSFITGPLERFRQRPPETSEMFQNVSFLKRIATMQSAGLWGASHQTIFLPTLPGMAVSTMDEDQMHSAGKPVFGTLICLVHKGVPIIGIIDQPVLHERWVGVKGQKSLLNGQEIETRPCSSVGNAYLYTTSPHLFSGAAEEAFSRIRDQVKVPLYGCDCYAYGLLAAGHVDLVIESGLKPYDFLALVPVVEGAGGLLRDWKGQHLRWWPSGDGSLQGTNVIAAGDVRVYNTALASLSCG